MNVPKGKAGILAFYGQPGTNIVTTALPWPLRLAWDMDVSVGSIRCHRLVVRDLLSIFQAIWSHERLAVKQQVGFDSHTTAEYDSLTLAKIQADGLDLFGGCYVYRNKRGSKNLSTHAWGIAIDLNPVGNPFGEVGDMPEWVVAEFESRGWVWGGRWKKRDDQHYQAGGGY